jgi:hypothetical protein
MIAKVARMTSEARDALGQAGRPVSGEAIGIAGCGWGREAIGFSGGAGRAKPQI